MKVLVADDERFSLEDTAAAIKEAVSDIELFKASDYRIALDICRENRIDVAFLDIEMPGITGLELAKQLKDLNPDINIVFVTGHVEYALDAHAVFASGYLVKPADVSDVEKVLRNLRNPVHEKNLLKVHCFGNFEVFAYNRPVLFRRAFHDVDNLHVIRCEESHDDYTDQV